MNIEDLGRLARDDISAVALNLNEADVRFLVETLTTKDDTLRYNAFLLLQANSRKFPFAYEHWDELEAKLENENSYQRSLGLMLISENVRWDRKDKFEKTLPKYLACCTDEKFITARQAIQGLATILDSTDKYDDLIEQGLSQLFLAQYKANQQRLLKKDITSALEKIKNRT